MLDLILVGVAGVDLARLAGGARHLHRKRPEPLDVPPP